MTTGKQQSHSKKLPVLIVGAGPVGLTLALQLTKFGVPVRIFDKAVRRTDKSKALVLWSRTLELLGNSAQKFIDGGLRVTGVSIFANTRVIGRLDVSGVQSPYPFALMIPQSETERLLEEMLNQHGVIVERGVEVTSVMQTIDYAQAELTKPDGDKETVVVHWLVGCDGAHSLVRHSVGVAFDGETLQSDWILGDVHIEQYPLVTEVLVHWHRKGILVMFPITPDRLRIIANVDSLGVEEPVTPTLDEIQKLVDERTRLKFKVSNPEWLAGFRINDRKVKDYRYGRLFLAGDAAHIHSPAGGQGMNTGMQDAFNLAWKLALVTKGVCRENLLDSYSCERSYVGDIVLKASGRLTKVATLRSSVMQEIRNFMAHHILGLSPVQRSIVAQVTEVSIHYPDSPLNGGHVKSRPHSGERFLSKPGSLQPDEDERFALHAGSIKKIDQQLFSRFENLLQPTIYANENSNAIYLVRADGYVACSSEDPGEIFAYLSKL